MPKVAQHTAGGVIYNAWVVNRVLLEETSVAMCQLPMFHVYVGQRDYWFGSRQDVYSTIVSVDLWRCLGRMH